MRESEAWRLRFAVEQSAQGLDDATASTVPTLFPRLKQIDPNSGKEIPLIKAGTRINWKGIVKRAAVDLWDTPESNPDNAPALWENIQYRDGYRIIPPVITAGLAFALDECGWWGDVLYRSKSAANVYTPEQYPAGWESVKEVIT